MLCMFGHAFVCVALDAPVHGGPPSVAVPVPASRQQHFCGNCNDLTAALTPSVFINPLF